MTIRTRLWIGLILFIALLATTGVLLLEMSARLATAMEHSEFAQHLMAGAFRLSMVTQDYLAHPSARPRAGAQWTIEYEDMVRLVETTAPSVSEHAELLERITVDLDGARSLFADVAATHEQASPEDADRRALAEERQQRLAGQVMLKLRSIVDDSQKLANQTREKAAATQTWANRVLIALVMLLAALAVGDAIVVFRAVVGPIARLHHGTVVIAQGDLDHRVDVQRRDEVGDLAVAFNDMAARLQETLGALKQRIHEYEDAEEQIHRQNALLAAINEVFQQALICQSDQDVARTCLGVAETLTESRFGFIGEINEAGRFDAIALSDPGWGECRMPKPNAVRLIHDMEIRGIWGAVLKSGQPVVANDAPSHPDAVGIPEGHPKLTSFLGVPLTHGDRTIGMIALANKDGGYHAADQEAVKALSVSFAEALLQKRAEIELHEHREHLEDLVKKRTAQLEESEARFRELYDQAPVGYHELDSEGRLTRINRTELDMLGYDAQDMLGRHVWEFSIEMETSRRATKGKLSGAAPLGKGFERTYRRKDGSTFPALIEDRHLRDARDRIVGLRSTIQDITRLKKAEERLKDTMGKLEESNRELEQFAYVASHDLQEPLRMVASYTQLLARRYRDKLDADANEFISFAVDGAQRMQQLISDLLAYSRVTMRGKAFEPTDCQAVFDEALTNLKVRIEETGAEVSHGALPTMSGDRIQLVRLLQNLISNAIKFRGEESPRVDVSAQRKGDEWVFTVSDNGIGIEPQYAERIFTIFQRLHGRGEYPGTGIGLAVCKRIVERHGGRIWVESAPGEGATFYFTLPA